MNKSENKIIVGVTIGDINGIGAEVILKTFLDSRMFEICTPVVFGNIEVLKFYCKQLGLNDYPFHKISSFDQVHLKKLNVYQTWNENIEITPGISNSIGGEYALKSIQKASEAIKNKKINCIVTAPINKDNIQSEAFQFKGHTEYFESTFEGSSLMLMASENLKIGLATNHIPLKDVAGVLSVELLLKKLAILNNTLITDFQIRKPKIAVLGLNPHAGDNGLIGEEEKNIIIPAINKAQASKALVFGPYPADGFFGSSNFKNFDAVLAMYHDQGLIPFKSMTFGNGVNFTAGLNIIRTSPDHGTAYEIAGQNIASPDSFRYAVYMAIDIVKNRKLYKSISANPLKVVAAD